MGSGHILADVEGTGRGVGSTNAMLFKPLHPGGAQLPAIPLVNPPPLHLTGLPSPGLS